MVKVKNVISGVAFFLIAIMVLYVGDPFIDGIISLADYDTDLEIIVNVIWGAVQLTMLALVPFLIITRQE